jgi:hypothetical protein
MSSCHVSLIYAIIRKNRFNMATCVTEKYQSNALRDHMHLNIILTQLYVRCIPIICTWTLYEVEPYFTISLEADWCGTGQARGNLVYLIYLILILFKFFEFYSNFFGWQENNSLAKGLAQSGCPFRLGAK